MREVRLSQNSSGLRIRLFMNLSQPTFRRALAIALLSTALVYAFCAGFRTIGDFDFGWQIATGRYVVQHHQIPRSDVFSYTSSASEWLYPPFAGVILYWFYLLGGYSALSWLLAIASVVTIALLARRAGAMTAIAAILAVPSIVFREAPRAELFTTVLFAAYVAVLWKYFREGRARLWLLPLLMLFWANLHPGFVSGLALLTGYILLELCELPFSERRQPARERLRRIAPWLAASTIVTIVNPWGPRIYLGLARQSQSVKELGDFIGEWSRPNLSVNIFHEMLRLRGAESAFWWLLLLSLIATVAALWRKQIGAAIWIAGAAFLSVQYLRFQGLFACIAVVIGGSILDEWLRERAEPQNEPQFSRGSSILGGAVAVLGCFLIGLSALRCADLVTNREYIASGQVVLFGPGEAPWFPEKAVGFIRDHHLPGNVFNDYNLGGFLDWSLPEHKVYVDSRAIPFGLPLLSRQRSLLLQPLDSPEWTSETAERNLNLIVLSVQRYTGLGKVALDADCKSRNWRPVYLDDVAAVFLRNSAQNSELLHQLEIDCSTVPFAEPHLAANAGYHARADEYNFYANAGALFYLLGRDQESARYLDEAAQLYPDDANLHLTRAELYQADGLLPQAEAEFKRSIAQRPTDIAWYLLGVLYGKEHRYPEAAEAMTESAEISYTPADRYRIVGQIDNAMQQPKKALAAFDHAEREGSHGSTEERAIFAAQLATGRARSWQLLGDLNRAIEQQRIAVDRLPQDGNRWATLADLYRAQGDLALATSAQAKADSLRANPAANR